MRSPKRKSARRGSDVASAPASARAAAPCGGVRVGVSIRVMSAFNSRLSVLILNTKVLYPIFSKISQIYAS